MSESLSGPGKLWVKICATTNLPDALLAAELGADAVGFVFAPSPRQVTAEEVAAITPHLPDEVERVGVFTGSSPADISWIAASAESSGLTAIQLHGGVNLAFAKALQDRLGHGFPVIHTAHWTIGVEQEGSAEDVSAQLTAVAGAGGGRVLVDAMSGSRSGGLGLAFDWATGGRVFRAHPGLRLIVAGGLRPENVAEAIVQLLPYGVDVASGVEQRPGKKDPAKLRDFIQKAREAV